MPLSRLTPIALLTCLALAYVLLPYTALSGLLYVAIGATAAALLIVAWARFDLDQPSTWLLLIAGLLCWVAGDATWFALDELGIRSFPSFADALYLAAYPLWWIALSRVGRAALTSRGELIDAAIISISIGVVAWAFVLGPLITDASLPLAARLTTVTYTVGDMLLVLLIVVSVITKRPRKPDHVLLLSAIVVFLATNLFYSHGELAGTYVAAGIFDLGWLATYLLFVAGAWHPSATRPPPPATPELTMSTARLVALTGASLLAPLVALFSVATDPQVLRVASAATIVILLLVIYRIVGLNRNVGTYVATLEELAQTDPLTGALNRRQLDLTLARELARAQRTSSPLCLALLDLDNFKQFNDTHGHAEGDRLLRDMVAGWQELVRRFDVIARYGGEEFVVVFPSTTVDEAVEATERLRAAVPFGQRVSVGLAQYVPDESADELIRRADSALYAAKRAGKGRVTVAGSAVAPRSAVTDRLERATPHGEGARTGDG